jgi:tetratricopeptide (TPR) repeat protein
LIKAFLMIHPKNIQVVRIQRELLVKHLDLLKKGYKHATYEEILNAREQVINLNPFYPGIDFLVGRASYSKKHYAEALSSLVQATALDNNNQTTWLLRAKAAIKAENYIEALFTLNQVILNFSINDPNLLITVGEQKRYVLNRALTKARLLHANDDLDSAWKLTNTILIESSQNKQALKLEMLILRKMCKNLQNATGEKVKIAQSIYEKDNDNVNALKVLAIESMRQKKFAESLIFWDKLSHISPKVESFKQQRQKCLVAVGSG